MNNMFFKKKKESIKKKELIGVILEDIRNDRLVLASIIVASIRKHWNILEDKLEQHTDEDDYGNKIINHKFSKDLEYFSDKVVLPALRRTVEDGKVSSYSLFFLLEAAERLPYDINENLTGIKFTDSDNSIAYRLLAKICENDNFNSEVYYQLHTGSLIATTYLDEPISENIGAEVRLGRLMKTVSFGGNLKTSHPIKAHPLEVWVFVLFSAMHNNKYTPSPKKLNFSATFSGNNPYKYEEFVKELLRNEGFNAKRTQGSGDYGVDVIAGKDGLTYAIQCKLYNHTVGTKAVQEIVSGRIYYKADFAIVVSDNSFTDAAKRLARRSSVVLTHHKDLIHKINDSQARITPKHNSLDSIVNKTNHQNNISNNEKIDQENKEERRRREADELITVILPTIISNK